MAKYKIWDKKSQVITPIGEVLSADEWKERYPMAKLDSVELVIGGGVINGSVCMEYTSMIESYVKMGCDFTGCETMQEFLDTIEAFEDALNSISVERVSDETRIADALEDMVVLQELASLV